MLKDLIFILFMHTKDLVGETWVEKVRLISIVISVNINILCMFFSLLPISQRIIFISCTLLHSLLLFI